MITTPDDPMVRRLTERLERRDTTIEALREREVVLVEALDGLLDACKAHNEANGRQMIDPHSEREAVAALDTTSVLGKESP